MDNTYLKIDLNAIRDNFTAVRNKAGVPVMAVVKANAYGHGAVSVAKLLEDDCAFFGVSSMAEAMELRGAGIQKPILILGHTPADFYGEMIRYGIRPAIFTWEDALALSCEAQKQGVVAPFHFALDTGMGRIGFPADEASADICAKIAALPNLYAEGLFSHYATADCADLSAAKLQTEAFDRFYEMLQNRGISIPIRHMNNSAGTMNFSSHYDMVRSGIVTYGLYPSDQVDPGLLPLKPAMSWHSHISFLKQLEPGHPISYGGTFVTTRPTLVATIPAGYADGYPRNLSNRFFVLIRGQKAPILGRVCMDQFMVDVTDIPGVTAGDEVVLFGHGLPVEQIAEAADSFNYEMVCRISRRVCRVYYRNGQPVHTVNYLLDK